MKKSLLVIIVLTLAFCTPGFSQDNQLSVNECVQLALKQNPEIIRGEFSLKIAGKDMWIALADLLPQVSTNMGYSHSVVGPSSILRIDSQTGIPVPVQPFEIKSWQSYAGANLNQTLFDGRSIFGFSQSHSLKKSVEFGFEDTKQTIIYLVKERYYNLLKTEKLLEVAQETMKSSEESYKDADVRYQVGKVPKSDVLKAKVQLEQSRLSLIEAQNNLSVAQASLNHVLGFDVDKEISVVDNLDVPEMEVGYGDAMQNALTTHPRLQMGTYDVKAAKAGMISAYSSFLPSVVGYAGYSWRHEDFNQIDNMFDTDYNWYVGVQLSMPVFQGFSRIATVSRSRLEYNSSKAALDQYQKDVALEVKIAYFEVQQSKKSIAVAKDAVESAEEDLRLNKEKYNLGAGTMLDLIIAQVSATQAKSDHIQALYNYKYAIARLQKAMGQLTK